MQLLFTVCAVLATKLCDGKKSRGTLEPSLSAPPGRGAVRASSLLLPLYDINIPDSCSYPNVFTRVSGRPGELRLLPLDIGRASLQTIKNTLARDWGLAQTDDLAFEITTSLIEANGVITVSTAEEWDWIVARHKGTKSAIFITLRQTPRQLTPAE